jgi:hypothetical protein
MLQQKIATFGADAHLHLNGNIFRLSGEGQIDEDMGVVEGKYRHDIPEAFVDPRILQAVLVTGYPSVCRNCTIARNPFENIDYSYIRHLDLGVFGQLSYEAECWIEERDAGPHLASRFKVQGQVANLPALSGALPLTETWRETAGGIGGTFQITWPNRRGGQTVIGQATTLYKAPLDAPRIPRPLSRTIVFRSIDASEGSLHIRQESWLSAGELE